MPFTDRYRRMSTSPSIWVNIYKTLSWDDHVKKVTQKANNSNPLSFSNRNISRFPANIKAQCYSKLARSSLEYAFTVWSPAKKEASARSRQSNSELLVSPLGITETNQQCYSDDEQKLNWTALEVRRNTPCLVIMLNNSGILDVCWKWRPSWTPS